EPVLARGQAARRPAARDRRHHRLHGDRRPGGAGPAHRGVRGDLLRREHEPDRAARDARRGAGDRGGLHGHGRGGRARPGARRRRRASRGGAGAHPDQPGHRAHEDDHRAQPADRAQRAV
ncbi:MAG: Transcriptional regulator, AsnC family, partial [uncultured Solirubrobacteraceae bacterium]